MDFETIKMYVITGLVIFLVLTFIFAFLFRKRVYCLVLDYVVDLGLSSLDELFGSLAYRIDWGDWIAAPIIYFRVRKFTSKKVALFAAWEATGYFPIPFIPIIGDGVDWFANFFPMVTLIRFLPLLNEFGPAKRMMQRVKDGIKAFSKEKPGIKVDDETFEEAEEDLELENPVEAIKQLKEVEAVLDKAMKRRMAGTVKLFVAIDDKAQQFHNSPFFRNEETREIAMQILAETMMPGLKGASDSIATAKGTLRKKDPHMYTQAISSLKNADAILKQTDEAFKNDVEMKHQAWMASQDTMVEFPQQDEDEEMDGAA